MGGALVLEVVELLCGHQRFGNADQAERRAALGNEIDLVSIWAQELWDLPRRPGPEEMKKEEEEESDKTVRSSDSA